MTDKLPAFLRKRSLWLRSAILAVAALALLAIALAVYTVTVVMPNLPAIDVITDYKPKVPLRIYTADGALIGEFGEEHRDLVPIAQMPPLMKKALLAIEDARFYEHGGVDWMRAAGAIKSKLLGGRLTGFSTITMQIPRNFVISREKVWQRKLIEILLAYRIEAALSKDQILELYMNHMYLGQRAYGFGSAARIYFGKSVQELSIAETAMLAGLPQNPAAHNPVANPKRAKIRQQQVLKRMRELDMISEDQYQKALHEPLRVNNRGQEFDSHAEYAAELARQAVYAQYKEEAYTRGIKVYTTLLKADQDAAYEALRRNVLAYDQRHGYRGPEAFIKLPADQEERDDAIDEALAKRHASDRLIPAVVLEASPERVKAETAADGPIEISGEGLKLAAPALAANARAGLKLVPGAVIRVALDEKKRWSITQVPQVQAAFISLDAETGATRAMVGGYDFNQQKFNHATQAWRQPGSSIKPFVYSAALEKGFSPATQILDEVLELPGENAGATWAPNNDDGVFDGPISMRTALAKSKNVPSVRLLRAIGIDYTHDYLTKFGFESARWPKNLTMALGTGSVTVQQMASAYAVFANGGYRVQPWLIARVVDAKGAVLSETKPPAALGEDQRAIDPRNVFVMDSMLKDVARFGTGAQAAAQLKRPDVAGKTGTTSDAMDGWFAGYANKLVAVAWMGYDEPKSLGGREFGATLALPIWIDYMRVALNRIPVAEKSVPEGVVQHDGDWLYEEYVGQTMFKSIDLDEAPAKPAAEPPPKPEGGAKE
ncbi:PBP1A family penicillin-binding protein [Massilia sp. TS11]|nr:PBP1A family penicillin-binding protein [Massilia sp. TS11]